MDQLNLDHDYENQTFEDMDINPYEIVIAVSREARQVNNKAMKYLGPETEIRPVNVALRKLTNDETDFSYNAQAPEVTAPVVEKKKPVDKPVDKPVEKADESE